ncbi:MAG: PAS domain S-box protein [Chitinophagaceae bacterium]|nr:MAG: PAS domain S-box protein [Chitinophagaceae bacterium]
MQAQDDLRSVFNTLPGNSVLLLPDTPRFTIVAVTDGYLAATGRQRAELVGAALFEAFPGNPDDANGVSEKTVRASLEYALAHRELHYLPMQRYDVSGDGGFVEKYWVAHNKPVVEGGTVTFLIHTVEDVTTGVLNARRAQQTVNIEKAYHLFMQAPLTIGVIRGDELVIELANERMLAVWGRGPEVIGQRLLEAIPELAEQGVAALIDGVRRSGQAFEALEAPFTLVQNGEKQTLYFDFIYQPYYESPTDAVASGVIGIVHDVTEKVMAREALEVRNRELRFVLDLMPQLVWHARPDGYADFFNKGFQDYTGRSSAELEGSGWAALVHPDDMGETMRVWQEAVGSQNDHYEVAHRMRGHDGSYRWFLTRGVPLKNEAGEVIRWYGSTTDIEEHKRAEEALRVSTERFNLVAKATQDAIWDWNLLTNEIWWNEGFRTLFGYRAEDIEPGVESWYGRIHPDDRERVVASIHGIIDNGGTKWSGEYRFRRADGSYAAVFDRGYALHDAEGKPVRMLGSMQDITVRKEVESLLEERVRMRTAELEVRNRELEQFTYVSHHDLQEPLRKIIMFTDMIRPEAAAKLSDPSRMRLDKVTEAARRMSAALRDVLNYASLNKEENYTDVDLEEVVAAVEQDLELVIAEKKAIIDVDRLPRVWGVQQQMHQLFYNLLNNALKFQKPGVAPRVQIACTQAEEQGKVMYHLTVSDNGIGFSADAAGKIFGMFQRLHSKAAYAGTGIGLALCQKVVQNHGGSIRAEGRPGEGACFHIRLPAEGAGSIR